MCPLRLDPSYLCLEPFRQCLIRVEREYEIISGPGGCPVFLRNIPVENMLLKTNSKPPAYLLRPVSTERIQHIHFVRHRLNGLETPPDILLLVKTNYYNRNLYHHIITSSHHHIITSSHCNYTETLYSLNASFNPVFRSVEALRCPIMSAQGTWYSPAGNFFG